MSPYPPFPVRGPGHRRPPARGSGSRRGFGSTWWGQAWVVALEERARLDPNRLPRGRSYARSGAVGELAVSAGEVRAKVQGSRRAPYDVVVRVRQFDIAEWDRLLDAIAAQVGHTAALLDGELPPEVVDDVAGAGLDLLPGAGEVGPRCSCPDWADPCKHAAAVCYLVSEVLDRDPFELLLLRGRSRDEVLAALRSRRGAASGRAEHTEPARVDQGVVARAAFARERRPLPAVPLPPAHAGRPAVLPVDPPPAAGVRREDLVALAADAANRAWEIASGSGDGGLGLDIDADLARRAAAALGTRSFETLAGRVGVPQPELVGRAIAWQAGGVGAIRVLVDSWQPSADDLAAGRLALRTSSLQGQVRVWRNRISRGDIQLRLGNDRLWYLLHKVDNRWEVASAGDLDPAGLLAQWLD